MPDRPLLLARRIHARFRLLGPPVPDGLVYSVLPRLNVELSVALPARHNGLSRWTPFGPQIVLRLDAPLVRRRWTLFHELGHLLLHRGIAFTHVAGQEQAEIEREADRFAAAVLLPSEWLTKDVRQGRRSPWLLARRYGVSRQAAVRRLAECGLIRSPC